MDTTKLRKFAQAARRQLHKEIGAKLEQVLTTDSGALRAKAATLGQLRQEIQASSKQAVVERVAYTWFNRFCALRFMDVNHYTRVGIVSPVAGGGGGVEPEILQEAKQGIIDPDIEPFLGKDGGKESGKEAGKAQILGLLTGRIAATDAQNEAYRRLLVAACNSYHAAMPFLFETIDDYTELLMPDDLLSGRAILATVREAMTPDACQNVEVIGWLYQFYISEKKDQVMGSKAKVSTADIPAATQLFTPHWIVRYLVENSLGRLWMLNRPGSRLVERMDYYIGEQGSRGAGEQGSGTQRQSPNLPISSTPIQNPKSPIQNPEAIRLCDPAAGSGHMLTYAFDLLYAIYEEEGYPPGEIPGLILTKNLTGLEIDERAGALAAFALTMKGRERDRRFLGRGVRPQIVVLRPMTIDPKALAQTPWMQTLNRELLGQPVADALTHDLGQLPLLDTVGSLLRPRLSVDQIQDLRTRIGGATDLFSHAVNEQVLAALDELDPLARQYDVVVANPPYMGGGGMNDELKDFAQDQYPDSKADLFAMFMERNRDLVRANGLVAMITMQSWMFLSSYEKLRTKLLDRDTILSMAHLGARAFDTIGGEVVSTTAFVVEKSARPTYRGAYLRLIDGSSEAEKAEQFRAALPSPLAPRPSLFYRAAAADFKKIPGSPIAYWISNVTAFDNPKFADIFESGGRTKTHGNTQYLRYFWEVQKQQSRWYPIANGGNYRKYYGNDVDLIDWSESARAHYNLHGGLANEKYLNQEGITWTLITSSAPGFRVKSPEKIYTSAAPTIFNPDFTLDYFALGFLNSKITIYYLRALNPTLNTTVGDVLSLPYLGDQFGTHFQQDVKKCVDIAKSDWDAYETSWDFTTLPLLRPDFRQPSLAATYTALRGHWQAITAEMQRLEEENNRLFIAAYGLQDELTPDVPLAEITLTCNPHYRYNSQKSPAELEALLLADTLRELISYAVGCLFGRYSLEKPGLILANAGETVEDYVRILGIGDWGFGIGDSGLGIGDSGLGIGDSGSGIRGRGSTQSPNLPISQSPTP